MKIISDNNESQFKLDEQSCTYLFTNEKGDAALVFARTGEMGALALEMIGNSSFEHSGCSEVSSFNYFPDSTILAKHKASNLLTVIVAPIHDDTNVYVIDHLPERIQEILSRPLPDPRTRGIWPHNMTVAERMPAP